MADVTYIKKFDFNVEAFQSQKILTFFSKWKSKYGEKKILEIPSVCAFISCTLPAVLPCAVDCDGSGSGDDARLVVSVKVNVGVEETIKRVRKY